MHLAMDEKFGTCSALDEGNSTRTEAVATDEEGDDDVKG